MLSSVRAAVQEHLANCDACASELAAFEQLQRVLARDRAALKVGLVKGQQQFVELQTGCAGGAQPLRELGQLQAFIGGVGITAFFDSPWVPVFVAVIWLMHPWLGGLALVGALLVLRRCHR